MSGISDMSHSLHGFFFGKGDYNPEYGGERKRCTCALGEFDDLKVRIVTLTRVDLVRIQRCEIHKATEDV
jgi:hypothetical protein